MTCNTLECACIAQTVQRSNYMAKLRAKNDWLIEELIVDPNYRINADGGIWTLMQRSGRVSIAGAWRRAGRVDKEGYREMRYKNQFIKEHRVVYRKFIGPLAEHLVIDHKNCNRADNTPDNL